MRRRSCSRSSRCSGSRAAASSRSRGRRSSRWSVAPAPSGERDAGLSSAFGVERGTLVRASVIAAVFLAVVLFVLPTFIGGDWITTLTSVAIYAVVAAGFGVLYGRVGMISLGQIALLVDRLLGRHAPRATRRHSRSRCCSSLTGCDHVRDRRAGRIAGTCGSPGLYLALITLMFAGATTIVLAAIDFPNGGGGFTGRTGDRRPRGTVPGAPAVLGRGRHRVLPLRRHRLPRSCSCSRSCTSRASPAAPGRRSARASRRRSPRA